MDLSEASDELNEAADGADLVVLQGAGRAVVANFDAALSVDTLHLALLRDPLLAARLGGDVEDCVCKYAAVDQPPAEGTSV